MAKVLQSKFRVTLTGGSPNIPGTWATFEGGSVVREVAAVWDGGGSYDLIPGRTTAEDITITRPFDPDTDQGWINQLRRNMANGEVAKYNVSKQATGANNASVGKPETFPGCVVREVRTTPTAAGSEATAATVEIVLATKGPAN